MLRKRENLPLSKGGRSPTPPRRQIDMPNDANCVCSCLYLLGGFCLIAMGYLHCMSSGAHARLRCFEDVCTFIRSGPEIQGISEISFLRENLVKAEEVQLDRKGKVIKPKRTKKRSKRSTPQTLSLTWMDGESKEQTTLPLTSYGLGRKNPKKLKDEVMDYVNKKRDELDIDESKWVSGIGVLCFVFGLLLIVVRFIVGAIVPPAPSRLHKNAAAPRKLFT